MKCLVDYWFIGVIIISVVNDVILVVENGDIFVFVWVEWFMYIVFVSGNLWFFIFKLGCKKVRMIREEVLK